MGLGLVGGMPFIFGLAPSLEQPTKVYRRVSPCLEAARICQNSADLGQPDSRREYRGQRLRLSHRDASDARRYALGETPFHRLKAW